MVLNILVLAFVKWYIPILSEMIVNSLNNSRLKAVNPSKKYTRIVFTTSYSSPIN